MSQHLLLWEMGFSSVAGLVSGCWSLEGVSDAKGAAQGRVSLIEKEKD